MLETWMQSNFWDGSVWKRVQGCKKLFQRTVEMTLSMLKVKTYIVLVQLHKMLEDNVKPGGSGRRYLVHLLGLWEALVIQIFCVVFLMAKMLSWFTTQEGPCEKLLGEGRKHSSDTMNPAWGNVLQHITRNCRIHLPPVSWFKSSQ